MPFSIPMHSSPKKIIPKNQATLIKPAINPKISTFFPISFRLKIYTKVPSLGGKSVILSGDLQ
jgi:hypothetical protein